LLTRVEILSEHEVQGVRNDSCRCALALAVDAILKPEYFAVVTRELVCLAARPFRLEEQFLASIVLPADARRAVSAFDAGHGVSLRSFELEIPSQFLRAPAA
jgi:hypothetical protein